MAEQKSILIWGHEDILSSSIELFLDGNENWKVVNLSNTEDLEALLRALKTTRPDIVIINQECQHNGSHLALDMIEKYPNIKVITVNLENNSMEVYSKMSILIKHSSDLIDVIKTESKP